MAKGTVIRLTESTKRLLSKMKFGEIPEEAKFVFVSEDGNAVYVKEFNLNILATPIPTHTLVMSWEDIEVGIEE